MGAAAPNQAAGAGEALRQRNKNNRRDAEGVHRRGRSVRLPEPAATASLVRVTLWILELDEVFF
jgi:hypothetical protein